MKKTIFLTSLILISIILSGCPANTAENTTANTENASNETAENKAENTNVDNSDSSDSGKRTEVKTFPASSLKFDELNVNNPVDPTELRNAVFEWVGKDVAIVGRSAGAYIEGDSFSLNSSGMFEDKERLVNCRNQNKKFERRTFDGDFSKPKPQFVIKGTISKYPLFSKFDDEDFKTIDLENCEIVSQGDYTGEKGLADATKIDINKPIPIADLHKDFFKWIGREVAVKGKYGGGTKSSTVGGEKMLDFRVDVSNEKNEKFVGCHFDKEITVDKADLEKVFTFKGKISGGTSEDLSLLNCSMN